MIRDTSAYGLWSLVIINTAAFLIFAFSGERSEKVGAMREPE